MCTVPLPSPPTKRLLLFVQVEPRPSTVTVPVEPAALAMLAMEPTETTAPSVMLSVPVPAFATVRSPLIVHSDEKIMKPPSTVTVPWDPAALPIIPLTLPIDPAREICIVPVPASPTVISPLAVSEPIISGTDRLPESPALRPRKTLLAVSLELIEAVPPLLICASVVELGTPLSQFPAVSQLPVASVQVVVWAKIGEANHVMAPKNNATATSR